MMMMMMVMMMMMMMLMICWLVANMFQNHNVAIRLFEHQHDYNIIKTLS